MSELNGKRNLRAKRVDRDAFWLAFLGRRQWLIGERRRIDFDYCRNVGVEGGCIEARIIRNRPFAGLPLIDPVPFRVDHE